VATNIVIFDLSPGGPSPEGFAAALADRGVRLLAIGGRRLRAVTHYEVTPAGVEQALAAAAELLGG
jgi:threonine aldolase